MEEALHLFCPLAYLGMFHSHDAVPTNGLNGLGKSGSTLLPFGHQSTTIWWDMLTHKKSTYSKQMGLKSQLVVTCRPCLFARYSCCSLLTTSSTDTHWALDQKHTAVNMEVNLIEIVCHRPRTHFTYKLSLSLVVWYGFPSTKKRLLYKV